MRSYPNQANLIPTLGAAIAFVAAVPLASGQETDRVVLLAPFTVTADGAQSVLQISERDISQRQATDLEDALSLDPSITVGGSTGIAQKIYVRNLGEGLLNVSVDGATQSGSLFHHTGRVAVEPDLLKQVEVQPSVGNAADGPGALGGAIRFITKDPVDLLRPDQRVGGLLKYGYFSNTDGYKASASTYGRIDDNWSGLLSLVYSDYGAIEDGDGNELAGSDTQQHVVMAKLAGDFENGQKLRFSFESLDESGNKLRRPEWAPGPGNPSFPMESQRNTAILGYGLDPIDWEWIDLDAKLSFSRASILQDAVWGPYEGDIETFQFDLRNTQRFSGQELIYGADFREDKVSAGPTDAPGTYQERGEVIGIYLQDHYQATERLSLSAGARVDFYRLYDQEGQSFSNEGLSPNLGFTYALTQALDLIGSVATAYRGPGINDAFRIDRSRNDPRLAAEKARAYELRARYNQGPMLFEVGAHQHRIDDVITNTLPWSVVYVNAGELETDGIFARAAYGNDTFNVSLQYNAADTTLNGLAATRYQYGSLVSTIGDTWVLDAFWRPANRIDVGWYTRLVEGVGGIEIPDEISGIDGALIDKPGYVTHDIYLRWSPNIYENLTFNLTIKNVFDKRYLSHGSVENLTAIPDFETVIGAPEPGRDVRLAATLRF